MLIQHKESGKKGVFFVPGEEDNKLAQLSYHKQQENTIIIDHTEVTKDLRGQNVGLQLVNSAAEFARTNNFKVLPICTFAKAIMTKKEEYHDLIVNEEF